MQTLWQDLRFAVRMPKKNPGFTIVAVLTLAVAIGANAVVFSVLNGLFLRALKVPEPEASTRWSMEATRTQVSHIPIKRARLVDSHRQDDAELCLAGHHARVSLGRFFERVRFDHGTHSG
jgi:hypothetical protein